ncbi:MAG: T9SS type A sorting domain-containing protein [Chitinophagales bacterium]|nr:T9SS type A sorting domain-containing protein [Chitinophagales bacterium]MDW8418053.1 T9SS type A sorting domain-containing protein [Chitinophagales bacterium]
MTVTSVGDFDYTNPIFSSLVDSCGIRVLYFPGGSVARFAHYYPGVIGYGIDTAQVAAAGYDVNEIINSPWYQDQLNNNNSFFEECVALAAEKSLSMIICANVTTGYLSDVQNMMALCETHKVPVKAMIFNTEVHLNADRHIFPSAKAYLDSIAPYVAFMKSNYPSVPLSVNAAPAGTNNQFFNNWNDTVSKAYLTEITNDSARGAINWWWDIPTHSSLNNLSKDQFFAYLKNEMLQYFKQRLPDMASDFKSKFKHMDVVQMGFKNLSPITVPKPADSLYNTLLAQIYFMKRILWKIQYNALNDDFFKSVSIHKISSKTPHDPIYSLLNGQNGCTTSTPCTSTTFDAYLMMKNLPNSTFYPVTLNGIPSQNNLEAYFFVKSSRAWFYFINLDSFSYTFSPASVSIAGHPLGSFSIISVYGQNGYKLYSRKDHPVYSIVQDVSANPAVIHIHPHSITMIETNNPFYVAEDDTELPSTCKIFPNPAYDGRVHIHLRPGQNVTLRIYDVAGRCVLNQFLNSPFNEIALGELPGGVYFIQVDERQTNITHINKFILIK